MTSSLKISKRIKAIGDAVKYETIADIGCDHGYLPIYLALNKRLRRSAACDVNSGPLYLAAKNILEYGFSDLIETRLSDGLDKIGKDEFDTLVVAGMGGMLAIEILNKNLDVTKSFRQIIIQPQHNIEEVRRYIHKIGFSIETEQVIFEDNVYYFILDCGNSPEPEYNETEYLLGKRNLEQKNAVFMKYLNGQIVKTDKIISTAERKTGKSERLAEIRSKNLIYKNAGEMISKADE